ncbi:MAG: diaminopimelate decarboxylase [Dysgonamonadaceae bacterium]|jgi:diaminopimelate decarboxylase|nr:diaminopimelate decarboxylase [Dysgonamonadaceae bacterium]
MKEGNFPIEAFRQVRTPFYFYNTSLLRETLRTAVGEANRYGYHLHYAVKANANPRILSIINEYGMGADCVSGGEIQAALDAGFPAGKIVFAGVGKADWEIDRGLENRIFCFNVESLPELEIINERAAGKATTASIALRINPEVDAHTHHHITTGKKENKFGINLEQLDAVLDRLPSLPQVRLIGIHFHIGSQLTETEPFLKLCSRANEIRQMLAGRGIRLSIINFGGGLGIDYQHPDAHEIPDFKTYFEIFHKHFPAAPGQEIHFEPGRSIVGQCGSLISKVLYVKAGAEKKFVILDAGFTELIRPALYDAYHKIENLTSGEPEEIYDVVGPICESSDCFAKQIPLTGARRGDILAIRSAGAYGEIMASQYNCRQLPSSCFSDSRIS